jgi:hypothetical protein
MEEQGMVSDTLDIGFSPQGIHSATCHAYITQK